MQEKNGFTKTVKTPTIDELASSGIFLNQYYVNSLCSPTRATFMTGRYSIHNTIETVLTNVAYGLPLNETTLPTLSIDDPLEVDNIVNQVEAADLTISGTGVNGLTVDIIVTDSLSNQVTTSTTVAGGVWSVDVSVSGLTDGILTIDASETDTA